MVTGDRDHPWRREAVDLVPGFAAERFVLTGHDDVCLYFLQLHMGAPGPRGVRTRLHQLWGGTIHTQATLPVHGCTVGEVQHVTREQVITGLAALLAHIRPTSVRTMDPDPEHDGGKTDFVCSDHVDHTVTAEFALAALARYREAGTTRSSSATAPTPTASGATTSTRRPSRRRPSTSRRTPASTRPRPARTEPAAPAATGNWVPTRTAAHTC